MAQRAIHMVSGNAQVVGAVATTIASFDLNDAASSPTRVGWDNCSVHVEAYISIYNSAGTVGATGAKTLTRGFKRVSGTASAVDAAVVTLANLLEQPGVLGATYDVDVSGTTIRLRFTGVAGQTHQVFGWMRLTINQP